jgi:hypothetical protein
MRTTIRRIEHLERPRPAVISGASPSDVRQRIVASLNDGNVPSATDAQRAGADSHPRSLRERILEHLSAQQP